ncbi:solanimycin biosynthesis cytochrome P450 SolI [Candidatus Pantoea multigeneris]|uniref:Cytochrome P450 n=1 Tax=Candidatus Pantoea multigeneris TaxID=2608357 RepID=A0ABX0RDX6_9GAMM|nr:solanimycin biosynthesis cytochrome P450 SolI [Pantoea multigeneris]NIF21659.1 cytochrome P450 [Pantoea multigeneris]
MTELLDVMEENINTLPLEQLNPARRDRFVNATELPVFERLRREDPVHYTPDSEFGPYWSLTLWEDIRAVGNNHHDFTSTENIDLKSIEEKINLEAALKALGHKRRKNIGFITMDPPEHTKHRKAVAPGMGPAILAQMEPLLRERAGVILDNLPVGLPFDWVDKVSKELTATVLATLFDFPFEDRRLLTYWSDMLMYEPGHGPVKSWEHKAEETVKCYQAFEALWEKRRNEPPSHDLISMLAHHPETCNMTLEAFRGTIVLLIIGGNDTTRNTISASLYWLDKYPKEYAKLKANPELVMSMVSETLRFQTPINFMSRVANRDVEIRGKHIRQGDRVLMWYLSGNRDAAVIDDPDTFCIDRERARRHLSFGVGVHACIGSRVAEMQLSIIWQEILKRFSHIKVLGEPTRSYSNFLHGFENLQAIIPKNTQDANQ